MTGIIKRVVRGTRSAVLVAGAFVRASKWFEMTPYPDDEWCFRVKDEPGVEECFTEGDVDVELADPAIFVRHQRNELIYWDTTDTSHTQQGYEIAECLKTLYEEGLEAFCKTIADPWPSK